MVELVRDLRGGRPADRPAHEQRPRAARPLVGAAPLRRAVRRRGRQPPGRDAQAQPRHLPARPGAPRARPRTAPRSWTTSPATWPPRWRRGWSACWSRATAPRRHRPRAGAGRAELSSWRRRRGEAVDGAGAGLLERGLGRPERGPGRDDVVDDQHRAADPPPGDEGRARQALVPRRGRSGAARRPPAGAGRGTAPPAARPRRGPAPRPGRSRGGAAGRATWAPTSRRPPRADGPAGPWRRPAIARPAWRCRTSAPGAAAGPAR